MRSRSRDLLFSKSPEKECMKKWWKGKPGSRKLPLPEQQASLTSLSPWFRKNARQLVPPEHCTPIPRTPAQCVSFSKVTNAFPNCVK